MGHRTLPIFKGYTVDSRLKQFRRFDEGINKFLPFECEAGRKLLAEMLATEFSRLVREAFVPEVMDEIRKRNRLEKSTVVCHTHDFADANMIMCEAWINVTGDEISIAIANDDSTLWNEAWKMAQEAEFLLGEATKLERIHGLEDKGELTGNEQEELAALNEEYRLESMNGHLRQRDTQTALMVICDFVRGELGRDEERDETAVLEALTALDAIRDQRGCEHFDSACTDGRLTTLIDIILRG